MNEQQYIQFRDANCVRTLSFHSVGAGGVDDYGCALLNITRLSTKRIQQLSKRALRAAGLMR